MWVQRFVAVAAKVAKFKSNSNLHYRKANYSCASTQMSPIYIPGHKACVGSLKSLSSTRGMPGADMSSQGCDIESDSRRVLCLAGRAGFVMGEEVIGTVQMGSSMVDWQDNTVNVKGKMSSLSRGSWSVIGWIRGDEWNSKPGKSLQRTWKQDSHRKTNNCPRG
jgi:hypothetical protein